MKKIISGKVRDVYEINDRELVIVATDRISAFDVILPSTVRDKGVALTLLSLYWFDRTRHLIPNHILSADLHDMPACFSEHPERYQNRTVLVKKLNMLPYEFVVRGYMFGSLWEEYRVSHTFCSQRVEGEYALAQKLAAPMVTPSIKNSAGHDESISLDRLRAELGPEEADKICDICLRLYRMGYEHALQRNIIIADTKFEFGFDEHGTLTLGDELFTPDSSRFWSPDDARVGMSPKSYDKQFVRDWLIARGLNGVTPAPELPEDIVNTTADIYKACYCQITGQKTY